MQVLFHHTTKNGFTKKLLDTLLSVTANDQVHVTRTIESFLQVLIRHRIRMPIVLLQIGSLSEAIEMENHMDLLDGLFLMMATDHEESNLTAACRRLYPRLLINSKDDIGLIAAVMKKRIPMNG